MNLIPINSSNAPAPNGHYEQGIVVEKLIFTSMQLPSADRNDRLLPIHDQAIRCFNNLISIVEAGGGSRKSLIKVMIYTTNMNDWNSINDSFEKVFGDKKVVRGVVGVTHLHLGLKWLLMLLH
ncbi:MAG: Rid family hydrolase [Cyclobacteriaceae bacterium]